ncbi:MAG: FtsQ-type POTRA domain-containing protein [Gammaproteobacteria bacterium]|nr:FtsQ-type POTRA domain-containing protein [Gammaproteobacteria bacterium]
MAKLNKAENKNRNLLRPVGKGLGLLLVLGGVLFLVKEGFDRMASHFPIEQVVVEGDIEHYDRQVIKSLVETKLFGNFFSIDVERIQQSLLDLPWIREASVSRDWPDKVTVTLKEHKAAMLWNDVHLLNEKGVSFMVSTKVEKENLPKLYGEESSQDFLVKAYQEMNHSLSDKGLYVTQVQSDKRGSVSVKLSNGHVIALGREEHKTKLKKLLAMYERDNEFSKSSSLHIDLRYANGFAVRKLQPQELQQVSRIIGMEKG